jgi:6-phosphogluconolactonase
MKGMPQTIGFALLLAVLAALLPSRLAAQDYSRQPTQEYIAYIGTYTNQTSKGIYAYRFNPAQGEATPLGLVAEEASPAFLAVHPNQNFLYAVSEIGEYEGQPSGAIAAYSIDRASGALKLLNKVASRGRGPAHLSVDQTGKAVVVANYGGGSTTVLPIRPDGSLGEATGFVQHSGSSVNPQRQKEPHAHAAVISPDNRFVMVPDLGTDQVLIYRLDPEKGSIVSNDPAFAKVAPGGGPRHFAFHPDAKFAYVNNELTSTVTAFAYDAERGALTELQTISTLPEGYTGNNSTAEIAVHDSGKFLYVSNRGHDSIALFNIDPAKGTLTAGGHFPTLGQVPRNFAIDPTGRNILAANQNSNSIVLFRVSQDDGELNATGRELSVNRAVCVVFVAAQ